MRSKNLTAVLALVFSLLGLHRFYLGQWFRGALYILAVPVVTVIVAGIVHFPLEETSNSFAIEIFNELLFAPWFAYIAILAIGVFDSVCFLLMSRVHFDALYNQPVQKWRRSRWVNLVALVAAIALAYVIRQQFFERQAVDVAGSSSTFTLTAEALAQAFSQDRKAAMEKYREQVLTLTGTVMTMEKEFVADGIMPVLVLAGSGEIDIRCEFLPSEADRIRAVGVRQAITMKGLLLRFLFNKVVMENCLLQETGHADTIETD